MGHFFASQSIVVHSWKEYEASITDGLFTIYGIKNIEYIENIRANLEHVFLHGETFSTFINATIQSFSASYADKSVDVIKVAEKVYRYWIHYAQNKARYADQITDDFSPWWEYVAILDQSTRHAEFFLNEKVFHFHDPIWEIIYPPTCLGGRGRVRPRTERSFERSGLTPSSYTLEKRQCAGGTMYGITIEGKTLWIDGKFAAKDFIKETPA